MGIEEKIKQEAIDIGFDLVGITDTSPVPLDDQRAFEDFAKSPKAADMSYMRRNVDKRCEPGLLMAGARSVIVVALNYNHQTPPAPKESGKVALYARYDDYHRFIKDRLKLLAGFIESLSPKARYKFCVDTVPVAERRLAQRAGLGFIAKNHMLTNMDLGQNLFLGLILTDIILRPDEPYVGNCGDCDLCIKSCPAGALRGDGSFDASRCLSYLTIESGKPMDSVSGRLAGNRLFGCDTCSQVCPFNSKSPTCSNSEFSYHRQRTHLDLKELLEMSEEEFESAFADSPIKRVKFDILKANARRCLDQQQGG
jgi:epoxyqueuosine reductase